MNQNELVSEIDNIPDLLSTNLETSTSVDTSPSVDTPTFKNLVISGGGFYCFQFFGIIKYLDNNNLLKDIIKYIGVSAGALINLLLIIGYKFCEIENFLMKFDF